MPKTRLTAKLCSASAPSSEREKTALVVVTNRPTPVPPTLSSEPASTKSVSSAAAKSKPKSLARSPSVVKNSISKASSKNRVNKKSAMMSTSSKSKAVFAKGLPSVGNASCTDFSIYKDHCDSAVSDSDSDADDLPDAFSSTSKVTSALPEKGDAVWVKYHTANFWPSLVQHANSKTRKLHVLLLDGSTETFKGQHAVKAYMKYSSTRIFPFNHTRKSEFELEGYSLDSQQKKKEFKNAMAKMDDYLNKRALGYTAACKEFLAELGESDKDVPLPPPSQLPPVSPVVPSSPPPPLSSPNKRGKRNKDQQIAGTEIENASYSDGPLHKKPRKTSLDPNESRAKRKERNIPLVKCICHPNMKEYLIGIYNGTEPSERHKLYHEGGPQRKKVKTTSMGPLDDDDQTTEVTDHIFNWCEELTKGQLPDLDYMFWVLLPEAIVRALQITRRVGKKKAEEIFESGIKYTKSERKENHLMMLQR